MFNAFLSIFGGCCTNVYTLEALVKSERSSGLLITFFQFLFATLAAYTTQFSPGSPYTIRKPVVPLRRWAFVAAMFFSINMLNNWAFAFRISVPVHIILRSFGSVTTMLAGYIRGKRYSVLQVISVALLTIGVLVSAWADSMSKGKSMSMESPASTAEFTTCLVILLTAQLLSAYMGAFVEDTYAQYKAHWTENLFYSHALSIPLFIPLASNLRESYSRLAATAPLEWNVVRKTGYSYGPIYNLLADSILRLPRGLLFLGANAMTQLVCISGVNLLCAQSSAVAVTIVLNIRKLVSFMLSTILFGHHLSPMMIVGSALVFGSGALYGWESSWRLPRQRQKLQANAKK